MTLEGLAEAVPGLRDKGHPDKFRLFGWWLHTYKGKPHFTGGDIAQCYRDLHFAEPSGYSGYLKSLIDQGDMLPVGRAYKLEHGARAKLDAAYGQAEATVKASAALTALAAKLPDAAERAYFQEAMICHNRNARRAAVVMVWNIAYGHLCDHILANRLADFNARWPISQPNRFKNNKALAIASVDDFNEHLKESEVMKIAHEAGIITKNVYNAMDIGLKRRNAAAHPSTVVIGQEQADAHILDMIDNVVLKIV